MLKDNSLKFLIGLILTAGLATAIITFITRSTAPSEITHYPLAIDRTCRDGRAKLYDECTDQREIFAAAQRTAREEDKVLLISYGAEWCIWCHVFSKYIEGTYDRFTHTYSDWDDKDRYTDTIFERAGRDVSADAAALNQYVADTFVVVHIDSRYAPGGDAVLARSGIDPDAVDWLPHIYTVKADGSLGGVFDHDRVEKRRDTDDWYRGYHRPALLGMLKDMREAAR